MYKWLYGWRVTLCCFTQIFIVTSLKQKESCKLKSQSKNKQYKNNIYMTNVTNIKNCTLQNNFISTIFIGYILHMNMILKGSKKATYLGLRALYTNVYKKDIV